MKKKTSRQKTNITSPVLVGLAVLAFAGLGALNWASQTGGASNGPASGAGTSTGSVARLQPAEYLSQFNTTEHLLVDVRTPAEFASGHIAGAVNIPVEALTGRLSEIPGDRPIVVYCRSGNRSVMASQILAQAGHSPIYDLGGILAWQAAGLPVE